MASRRTVAQWVFGLFLILFALTSLPSIEASIVSALRGILATVLFLAAATLVIPRTRTTALTQTDVTLPSWALAVVVLVAVVFAMGMTPVESEGEPAPQTTMDDDLEDAASSTGGDGGADETGDRAAAGGGEYDSQESERGPDDSDPTADSTRSDGAQSDTTGESGDGASNDEDADDETGDEATGGNGETNDSDSGTSATDGELEIHHIDVGQADSTLIVTPDGETILIDTGDWRQDGSEVLSYLRNQGIDRIDHLVATHGHADHVGGHEAVIEYYEENGDGIGAAYDPGVPHDTATYENYLDAIDEYDVDLFEVQEDDELPIDDDAVETQVLNPPAGDSGGDVDENSIALTIQIGDVRYLTAGDVGEKAEQRLVTEWEAELDADIYQAGHHGSSTSSTPAFMDAVEPEIVVISSDYDSQYGHPHDEVLERFGDRGLETYWTGVHSDVVITTTGDEIEVEPGEEFSTDPEDLLEAKPDDADANAIRPPVVDSAAVPIAG